MPKRISNSNVQKQLNAYITKQVVRTYSKTFQQRIITAFNKIKKEMLAEFLAHPITVEIRGGPDAENSSGTLNGYGNLFSFIGFDQGDNPIDEIEGILNLSKIEYGRDTETGFTMKIYLPSKQDIFGSTPMPWAAGRSWAEGIERGIAGFGRYLNIDTAVNSRSGAGIESESVIRKGKYTPVPYISSLLNKYTKKFQQINNVVVLNGIL